MVIALGQDTNGEEVRGLLIALYDENWNFQNPGTDGQNNQFFGNGAPQVIEINDGTWAVTSTGMTNNSATRDYYKDDNAGFTLQSDDIPLVNSNNKVAVAARYFIYKLYDETDDSSVDGTKWIKLAGSNASESTIALTIPASTSYRTADLSGETFVSIDTLLFLKISFELRYPLPASIQASSNRRRAPINTPSQRYTPQQCMIIINKKEKSHTEKQS